MREDICTIPISEVFEPKDGCPICRMFDQSENHLVEYITGAAMMEPDVRIETNRLGFCPRHLSKMMKQRNRLSVSLTLETHLREWQKNLDFGTKAPDKTQLAALHQAATGCFVCEKIDWAMERMLNTVCKMWGEDADFRKLYAEQTGLCMAHTELLIRAGQKPLSRKIYPLFCQATAELAQKQLNPIADNLSAYCKMYDYRNAGGDWSASKNAPEQAVSYLSGRDKIE